MRIIFVGNQNMGYLCLNKLLGMGEIIPVVVALPRSSDESLPYPSVEELALKNKIMVFHPVRISDPNCAAVLKSLNPDLILSLAWRQIFSKEIISIPKIGCINFHGALLPKYGGGTPTNWAIIMGEKETGVTAHWIDAGIDTGDIIKQKKVLINDDDTGYSLRQRMDEACVELFEEVMCFVKNGNIPHIKQDLSKSTYFPPRKPKDGIINWNQSAGDIYNLIRAITYPYPGAFSFINGKKIFIWESSLLAPEDKKNNFFPGTILKIKNENEFIVACGSGKLLIKKYLLENCGDNCANKNYFKAGMRFNSNQNILNLCA